MNQNQALRQQLVDLLKQSGAHIDFAAAVADLPVAARGKTPPSVPHSPWRLVEHVRIAQWDILEFCRNPRHVSPKFPDGYWPAGEAPPSPDAWDKTIAAFQNDLAAICDLVMDPTTDLFARIPHGEGQTILREALLVADHNAYHVGQLIVVRRALGAWQD
jgi:hypothetical protein